MVMWAGLKRKFWITTVLVRFLRAPATDESARPTPPTNPSVPSLKNSLRVMAIQFPPPFLVGGSSPHHTYSDLYATVNPMVHPSLRTSEDSVRAKFAEHLKAEVGVPRRAVPSPHQSTNRRRRSSVDF